MAKVQKNRIYSLIVGNANGAVEINNLQMKFTVVKTSNNKEKKNEATVQIYNLSKERRTALEEDYVRVSLKVGYSDSDLIELFNGQVVNLSTKKDEIDSFLTTRSGTDLVTKLDIDELHFELNNNMLSKIIPAGKTVRDVILGIIEDMPEVTRQEMGGTAITQQVPDGYPLSGTPRQNLDKLSTAYDLEWQLDQGVLYVSDVDGSFSNNKAGVPLIGQMSGLIERPEFLNPDAKRKRSGKKVNPKKAPKRKTLRMKILLNPTLVAGSIFKLEFEDLTGYYKVDEIKHEGSFRDNEWYSTIKCTEKID